MATAARRADSEGDAEGAYALWTRAAAAYQSSGQDSAAAAARLRAGRLATGLDLGRAAVGVGDLRERDPSAARRQAVHVLEVGEELLVAARDLPADRTAWALAAALGTFLRAWDLSRATATRALVVSLEHELTGHAEAAHCRALARSIREVYWRN